MLRALHQHIHLGAGVDAFDAFPHFLVLVMLAAEFAAFIERSGAEVQHVQLVSVDASRQALKRIGGIVVVAIEEHEEFALRTAMPALRAADKPEFCGNVSTENRASPEMALSIAASVPSCEQSFTTTHSKSPKVWALSDSSIRRYSVRRYTPQQ